MLIKRLIKRLIPPILLFKYQINKSRKINYDNWVNAGKPIPAPDNIKYTILDMYRRKYNATILIETGTYLGGMIRTHADNFQEIHTVELMEKYYLTAKDDFRNKKNITCHFGESVDMLKKIVPTLNGKIIYWLDAHYSVDVFARGISDCPALQELDIIFTNEADPIILIDDARDFTGIGDYPTVNSVEQFIQFKRPNYIVEVIDDIIVAIPKK